MNDCSFQKPSSFWQEDLTVINRKPTIVSYVTAFIGVPGFRTVCLFRWAAALYKKGTIGKFISKALCNLNLILHSSDIDARAIIGAGLRLLHPVGIVIGQNVTIGKRCWIMQNVTLGSAKVKGVRGEMDNPTIGDDVLISAGAVIAGFIQIGNNAKIGANSVVLKNVPEKATAVGVPARIIKYEKMETT